MVMVNLTKIQKIIIAVQLHTKALTYNNPIDKGLAPVV